MFFYMDFFSFKFAPNSIGKLSINPEKCRIGGKGLKFCFEEIEDIVSNPRTKDISGETLSMSNYSCGQIHNSCHSCMPLVP